VARVAHAAMATPAGSSSVGGRLEDQLTVVLTTSPVGYVPDTSRGGCVSKRTCFQDDHPAADSTFASALSEPDLAPSHDSDRRTHPSTRLIEEVFASIASFSGAGACAKIIVADGVKVREGEGATSKFRAGVVTREAEEKYKMYLRRVKILTETESSVLYGALLLRLDQRHGFAHALRRGLLRVKTPFVLVAQHDRSFVRRVDLGKVIDAMALVNTANPLTRSHACMDPLEAHMESTRMETRHVEGVRPEDAAASERAASERAASERARNGSDSFRLNYVGFPTSTTLSHERHVLCKYGLEVRPFEVKVRARPHACVNACANACACASKSDSSPRDAPSNVIALLPLLQFYDSMHVASTRWYLSRVFGRERYCVLPRGGFIEDTLGQLMLRQIREAHGKAEEEPEPSSFSSSPAGSPRRGNQTALSSPRGNARDRTRARVIEAHVPYGIYVHVASTEHPGVPVCGHIDGRDSRLAERGLKIWRFEDAHTPEEVWRERERTTPGTPEGIDTVPSRSAGSTPPRTQRTPARGTAVPSLEENALGGFFDPPDRVELPRDVWT